MSVERLNVHVFYSKSLAISQKIFHDKMNWAWTMYDYKEPQPFKEIFVVPTASRRYINMPSSTKVGHNPAKNVRS